MAFNPDWIPAVLAAATACGGVGRWVYRNRVRRAAALERTRQWSQRVDETLYGHPARQTESGAVYEPARIGLVDRVTALERPGGRNRARGT